MYYVLVQHSTYLYVLCTSTLYDVRHVVYIIHLCASVYIYIIYDVHIYTGMNEGMNSVKRVELQDAKKMSEQALYCLSVHTRYVVICSVRFCVTRRSCVHRSQVDPHNDAESPLPIQSSLPLPRTLPSTLPAPHSPPGPAPALTFRVTIHPENRHHAAHSMLACLGACSCSSPRAGIGKLRRGRQLLPTRLAAPCRDFHYPRSVAPMAGVVRWSQFRRVQDFRPSGRHEQGLAILRGQQRRLLEP